MALQFTYLTSYKYANLKHFKVGSANVVMYHAKQKHLASGGSDAHIYVFNPQNAFDLEHKIKTEYGGIFSSCMFGMNYACTGHKCGTINVWDVTSSCKYSAL